MSRNCDCTKCYKKNLTNRELARRLGLSESQVGKYVNNRIYPSLARLHEIAAALDVQVKDLFEPVGLYM